MGRAGAVAGAAATGVVVAVALAAPVQAAGTAERRVRCAVGGWRLAKAVLDVRSGTTRLRISGGAGAVLRYDGRTATHSYDGSRRLTESGTTGGRKVVGRLAYRRTLRIRTRLSGRRLVGSPSTASGPATLKLHQTRPLYYSPAPQSLVTLLRAGEFSGVPYTASFTCGRTTLRLRQNLRSAGRTLKGTWTYTRL